MEITDLNRVYLERGQLNVTKFGRGIAWLDTGTPESLLQAATFVQALEERQGLKVGCIEEAAYRMGFIDLDDLQRIAERMKRSEYGKYLARIVEEEA